MRSNWNIRIRLHVFFFYFLRVDFVVPFVHLYRVFCSICQGILPLYNHIEPNLMYKNTIFVRIYSNDKEEKKPTPQIIVFLLLLHLHSKSFHCFSSIILLFFWFQFLTSLLFGFVFISFHRQQKKKRKNEIKL